MPDHARGRSPYQTLRESRGVLARMAPLVRFGLFAAGVSLFLEQARPLLSDAQFTWGERRVLGMIALSTIVGFALGGWVLGRLMKVVAELLDRLADGAIVIDPPEGLLDLDG